jgi:N-acetylglutamate synthase-like GNAT family acetyltransferase
MNYTIRPAKERDQATIRTLIRRVGINPLGINWQRFLIAVDEEDAFIGCGQVKPHRDGSHELASIAVEEAWRERGVGRAIIRALQDAHPGPLWLTCRSDLIPFYEASGFAKVADLRAMPPYFRRIKLLFKLYQTVVRRKVGLAVMVCCAVKEQGA